jgi:deoxyribodipyrimidine photolyase-related protein
MVLRLILGDQLSYNISSLSDINPERDTILMCEVWEEATYVKHHKKKIAFLFSAMRHFAQELKAKGFPVHYIKLDDPKNRGSFRGEVKRVTQTHKPAQIFVTTPSEYRVLKDIQVCETEFGVPVEIRPDHRFLCTLEEFADWARGRKQLRLEYFYREMRKKCDILMDGNRPVGGKWNLDKQNRRPPSKELRPPPPTKCVADAITKSVFDLVREKFPDHFGDLEPFHFGVTRKQALQKLKDFLHMRLPYFGEYQDAMLQGEPWMYHSIISHYLNCGLLEPLEVIKAAECTYNEGHAPLNAVEGFIRQILGWREYVRGIYWLKMPEYSEENFFNVQRKLPWLYWSGDTQMNCLRQCVLETKQNAYAHHIQRLMVLGNFALIAGIDPKEVNKWYLIVYADAYEWVELPNVSGMVLFADGGYLASKPYAAGGSYINRMSDYCKSCFYKVNQRTGPDACPFNYLYWDFFIRNEEKLKDHQRLGHSYRTLRRMGVKKTVAIKADAKKFLKRLDSHEWV